ncbi:hypothetical protein [Acetobacterium wieringae]|uniref:hypothetical protein n=1 Tax=Acetobacterium wieringae TaxID=52694 RepID=UPI00203437D9|nr:hypothetical protein [Acetobacterium wieringae]URN84260.1 hypothetical protein CHL1_003447 [Acetobacterium wieringae]
MIKNKKLLLTLLVTATISGLLLTGCTSTTAETKTATTNEAAAFEDNASYGEVTAVSGSTITLALGTMNMGGGQTPPDQGQAPTENTTTGTPPEKPADDQTTPPADGSTTAPSEDTTGTMPEFLTLTGETATIELTDAITLTQMSNQKPDQQTAGSTTATAADITVGSILRIIYQTDSTEIESIEIMMTQPDAAATTNTAL